MATVCADANTVYAIHSNKHCVANLQAHLQEVVDRAWRVYKLWHDAHLGISMNHYGQDVVVMMENLANGCYLFIHHCIGSPCGSQIGSKLCHLSAEVQSLTRKEPQDAGDLIWKAVEYQILDVDKHCFISKIG